jgi:hypothetical protein
MSDMAKYPFLTQRSGSQNWQARRTARIAGAGTIETNLEIAGNA